MFPSDFLRSRNTLLVVFAAILLLVGPAGAQKAASPSRPGFDTYHAGPWEQTIGYSQAVRNGNMLYVSGTVGADNKGQPADLDGQMKKAYAGIQKTLAHYNTDLSHVVMERIYTTDIEALIRSQPTRKQFYGDHAPAATWVEVKRLYGAADKIEIEIQVALD
jgi:enamine deaminase RidA (YjgF/YER057c/UK114 family)